MSFLDKFSQTTHVLSNDSKNKTLPSVLCEGIFRVFVDYNINKNNSSVDVKNHFYGAAMTVSWFPPLEHSGWYGQRKKIIKVETGHFKPNWRRPWKIKNDKLNYEDV